VPRLLPLLLLALLACGNAPARTQDEAAAPTVIYLTRHAEKAATPADDPVLLPEGERRAERLATLLSDRNVSAIYATDFARTLRTAAPLAHRLALTVQTYAADASPTVLTTDWLGRHSGETILVVGHSNTVPGLVNALIGEDRFGDLDEEVYDRLYRVTLTADGTATAEELTTQP
jgi:broad specificity phosphatase PhoE